MFKQHQHRARRTLLAYSCIAVLPAGLLTAGTLATGLLATAGLLAPGTLRAQAAGTASVQGSVKDASGAALPNADVVFTNTETGAKRQTKSSGSGDYSIPNVPVGNYSLTVTAQGFSSFKQIFVFYVWYSS